MTITKKPPTGGVGGFFDGSIVDGLACRMTAATSVFLLQLREEDYVADGGGAR